MGGGYQSEGSQFYRSIFGDKAHRPGGNPNVQTVQVACVCTGINNTWLMLCRVVQGRVARSTAALRHTRHYTSNRRVISFHYKLSNEDGVQLDSSDPSSPMSFLEGAGNIIPGLEKELVEMSLGDKKVVTVQAKDAYGEYKEELLYRGIPIAKFPPDVKVGDAFQVQTTENGVHRMTVHSIDGGQVTVDANHPLAGQQLVFDVEIAAHREAHSEELTHGHAHGPGGHHHHHTE